MKPKKLLAALLAAACFLGTTGCASQSIAATDLTKNVKKAEQTVCLDEDTQDKTIEEVTGFGVKLLQSEMENENPLLSPLSVLAALSMTANGARGGARRECRNAQLRVLRVLVRNGRGQAAEACKLRLAQGHADASRRRCVPAAECRQLCRRDLQRALRRFDEDRNQRLGQQTDRQNDSENPR